MSLTDATPTGNAQLDGLLTLMRQPVPAAVPERQKVFGAVRKSISELQNNLHLLTEAQVKRLHVCIAEYEARTKEVQAEIHADLSTLRQQVQKTHPTVQAGPAVSGAPAAQPEQALTLDQYVNQSFPDPAQRTGLNWSMRYVWYGLYRMAFGIGKFFRRGQTPANNQPAAAPANLPNGTGPVDLTDPAIRPDTNLLAFTDVRALRLGPSTPPLFFRRSGNQVLAEIGGKRYRMVRMDNNYTGQPANESFSERFVSHQNNISIRYENNELFMETRGIPLAGDSTTRIPIGNFRAAVEAVVKAQAAGQTTVATTIAATYTGRTRTGPFSFTNDVNKPWNMVLHFIEVP